MPAHSKTKVELLLAGIQEVRLHGVQNFSVRRIAASCGVSCSAPYKHFKNNNDYILAILHYINQQWHEVEHEILSQVPNDTRERLVAISLAYIRFLQENPHYRAILMLRDESLNPAQIREKSSLSASTMRLVRRSCREVGMPEEDRHRKLFVVRAAIYGAAWMMDSGELDSDEDTYEMIRGVIEREFDLP